VPTTSATPFTGGGTPAGGVVSGAAEGRAHLAAESTPAEEPSSDEGWVIGQIRAFSPTLAAILSQGFEATMGEDLLTAAGVWLAEQVPNLDLKALAGGFTQRLGEALSLLVGAAQGDVECCERLAELAKRLTALAGDWTKAEGPLFDLRDTLGSFGIWASTAMADLLDQVLATGSAIAEQIGLTTLLEDVNAGIEGLGAAALAGIDSGLALFGLPALSDLPGWILEKAGATLATAASIGGSALDVLAQLAMAIPGMDTLASVGDALVLAGDAAAWMAANWGNPGIWETDGAQLREQYGASR
jgi:hypothetical protein